LKERVKMHFPPVAKRRADSLWVECYSNSMAMGIAAAREIGRALISMLDTQDEVCMIFAAAPSQSNTLHALCKIKGIDWSRVVAFHMDEYIGLPQAAPQSFALWLDKRIFSILPFAQVHKILPGRDPQAEAHRYENLLKQAPIDIVCLGVGVNGHIAFNDPPAADFDDPRDVKVVELDEICRLQQVDDECFAHIDDVPHHAITLTVPALMSARKMICVVPGKSKRQAVNKMLFGSITTQCPASILRTHPSCKLFLDAETCPYDQNQNN